MKHKFRISIDTEQRKIIQGAVLFGAITLVNSVTYSNSIISVIIALIETGVLIYSLLFKNVTNFIMCYIYLMSASIENSQIILGTTDTELFSFRNLPFIHIYHLLLLLALGVVKSLKCIKDRKVNKIVFAVIIYFAFQSIVTLFTILINDNGMAINNGMIRFTIRDTYNFFEIVCVYLILIICLKSIETFGNELKRCILSIMIGITVSAFILVLIGNYRITDVSKVAYLICPLVLFMASSLMLEIFNSRNKFFVFVLVLLSLIIQMKYTLGIAGTWIIYVSLIAVMLVLKCMSKMNNRKVLFIFCFLVVGYFLFNSILNELSIGNDINQQVLYKFTKVGNLLAVKDGIITWYSNLGDTIGCRIEQMINIILEYREKPLYLLFGKGFGGTITKHWGIYDWNVFGSTFPDAQIYYGVYSSFHTGLAEIMCNFGLIGCFALGKIIVISIREFMGKRSNGWCFIGLLWLIFFFYFYHTLIIGLACLCYGLFLSEKKGSSI